MSNTTTKTKVKAPRLTDFSKGRGTSQVFNLDPTIITIRKDWNKRREMKGIPELATAMFTNGQKQPIIISKEQGSDKIFLDAGERRLRASLYIVKHLDKNWSVKCVSEKAQASHADRLFTMLEENSGMPFSLLEKADIYLDLKTKEGLKVTEIAARSQATKQAVSQALKLIEKGSPDLLSLVQQGKLSGTLAGEIIDTYPDDHTAQIEAADAAILAAEEAGKTHATKKHLPTPNAPFFKHVPGDDTPDQNGIFQNPHKMVLIDSLPKWKIDNLELHLAHNEGQAFIGHWIKSGKNEDDLPVTTMLASGHSQLCDGEAYRIALSVATKDILSDKISAELLTLLDASIAKHDLPDMDPAADKPRSTGTGEAPPTENTVNPDDDSADDDLDDGLFNEDTDEEDDTPTIIFTGYELLGRPPHDGKPDGEVPEELRFVASDIPSSWGIQSFHVLISTYGSDERDHCNSCFGYRITLQDGSVEEALPNTGTWDRDASRIKSFEQAIEKEAIRLNLPAEAQTALTDAWNCACNRYFDAAGYINDDAFESLNYVKDLGTADNEAITRIKSASDTNYDGSRSAPGEGGYVAPDKKIKAIEDLLNKLEDDDTPTPIHDRITTVELVLSCIANQTQLKHLKSHLLGK